MSSVLNIAVAQMNAIVGDLAGNADKILLASQRAHEQGAHIILTPELSLTGYPPEDLLLLPHFMTCTRQAFLALITRLPPNIIVLIGLPWEENERRYNSLVAVQNGKIITICHKQYLPNTGVFDEHRYFVPGKQTTYLDIQNIRVALLICEDVWHAPPLAEAHALGAQLVLIANASPYHINKQAERLQMLCKQQQSNAPLPMVYANLVGGQDELIFDGRSFAINSVGHLVAELAAFEPDLQMIQCQTQPTIDLVAQEIPPQRPIEAELYQALCLCVHDYVIKNNFKSVLIGLSGGIDSALVLAIAVDALGADRTHVASMPSRYTADISNTDAHTMASTLKVTQHVLDIEPIMAVFTQQLAPVFQGYDADTTEENLQARIRGTLLMALSNKLGHLVLTTSNKSESAVGYSTLYGDMAGGFCVLKDVSKTWVYRLARWRNQLAHSQNMPPPIPTRIIERAPSAELRNDQTDQDSLPDYDSLDHIVSRWVEQRQSLEDITKTEAPDAAQRVIALLQRNEYKRFQAPPGPRITACAFGRDWRMPLTSQYKDQLSLPSSNLCPDQR